MGRLQSNSAPPGLPAGRPPHNPLSGIQALGNAAMLMLQRQTSCSLPFQVSTLVGVMTHITDRLTACARHVVLAYL